MGTLEQINEMKGQGIPEAEIIGQLQDQGIAPKAIEDALSQSQIKNAITDEPSLDNIPPSIPEQVGYPQSQDISMPLPPQQPSPYSPQTQDISESYAPGMQTQIPAEEYYPQEGYGGYAPEGTSSGTLIEISEQVFEEKIKKIKKQINELNEFKILAETKIEHNAERLKRIESSLDKMQSAILEKVGAYGNTLDSIKKEMSMMQDSFGKVVNKAVKGHHKHTEHKTTHKKTKKKSSKKK